MRWASQHKKTSKYVTEALAAMPTAAKDAMETQQSLGEAKTVDTKLVEKAVTEATRRVHAEAADAARAKFRKAGAWWRVLAQDDPERAERVPCGGVAHEALGSGLGH